MNILKEIILASLTVAVAGMAFAAITTSHLGTDQEMLDALDAIAFVAEGRVGDLGGAATFELDLGEDTGAPAQTRQFAWTNGQAEPFSLTYDDNTNVVTFTLGGQTLQFSPGLGFKEMFVRTRAVNAGSSITVDNLVLNGDAVGDQSSAAGDGLDILVVSGVELDQGFTLTGDATLSWSGQAPTQSRLAFQIKVGNAPTVPTEKRTWGEVKGLYR